MKLHLGCGKRYIEGYVHIDAISYDHVDHVSSIESLPFIEDNTVDVIYACHVVEHFKRRQVKAVLSEWRRVLKPSGTLRLSVPDFESICNVYTQTKNLNLVIGPLFGNQNYLYNIHYNTFDFTTLYNLLKEVGFNDITKYNPFKTEHSHVDDYSMAYIPHMDFKEGTCISLNVEAIK